MEIKFVYLVIGKLGITCCDSLEIAQDIVESTRSFDSSITIQKQVLFTKEIY